jgi:hypothetical protein
MIRSSRRALVAIGLILPWFAGTPIANAQTAATPIEMPAIGPGAAGVPGPLVRTSLFTYGIDAGIGETDNVNLMPSDKVSQTIATTDLDFALNEQTRLLNAKATGDFSYLDYLQNAYSPQLIGRFDGTANVAIVPEHLTWSVRDDFGQAALNAFTPTIPTNLENINYFSTGPDLSLRLSGIDYLNASARYARAQFQTSPFSSNRALGSIAVGRYVSADADVSLNAATERVMFDNTTLNTDFDRTSVYGRYTLKGARTDFEADLGASLVSPSSGSSTTGALAKLQVVRKISPSASITLAAGRELTDGSSGFSTLQSGAIGLVGTAGAILTSSPYTSNFASAKWQYARRRTKLSISARWERDTYAGLPIYDLKRPGVEVNVERRLTRSFTAQLIGSYYRQEYPNAVIAPQSGSSNTQNGLIGAALTWRHGRGLEIRLRVDHDYQGAAGGTDRYHENRAFLTVGYRPSANAGTGDSQ